MKNLFGFFAICLFALIMGSCTDKKEEVVVNKLKSQDVDTILVAVKPGYTYDVTLRKIEIEDEGEIDNVMQEEKFEPVLVTASGKVISIPRGQNISIQYDAFEDRVTIPYSGDSSDMDTSHVWVYYDGQEEPVRIWCINGLAIIPCGDVYFVYSCEELENEFHCDSPPPSENE